MEKLLSKAVMFMNRMLVCFMKSVLRFSVKHIYAIFDKMHSDQARK